MIHNRVRPSPVLVLAGALALAAAGLPAQSQDVLGPRNAEFLEGLWRAGYIEYADQIGQLVAASNLPEAEKRAVGDVHTRLKIAIAAQAGDTESRRTLVMQLIDEKKKVVAAATLGSAEANAAIGDLVEQYRLLADSFVEALGRAPDDAARAEITKQGDALFQEAVKSFEEWKNASEKLRVDGKPETDVPFMVAAYGLGRVRYYHSLVFESDSHHGKQLAERAMETLQDFDLEFGDSLVAFEAKLTIALCYQRIGDAATAVTVLDDAIALRERFEKDKKGVYQVEPDAADVISAAVLQKAMLLKDQKQFQKILDVTKDYLATIPRALEAQQGLAVLAAQAEAQMELGDTEGATATANQLVERDPKGLWGYRGQQILGQLIAGGGGKTVDTARTLRIAESLAGQGEYEKALLLCRETVLRATTPEGAEFAAEAMLTIGAIYASRGWFHEASVAFDAVVRRFPKSNIAPDALWRALQCFIELEDSDGLPMYKRLQDERSAQLVRDYPDDPHVAHLQLLAGQKLQKAQKFLEAAALFERVPPDSAVAMDARYYASDCYLRQARKLEAVRENAKAKEFLTKATEGLKTLLADIDNGKLAAADQKVKARLEQLEFNVRIALANLYLSGEPRPADAEVVLAPIKLQKDDKQAPLVVALRVRIKIAQGKVAEAAADMQAAIAQAGDARPLVAAARTLATALDDQAVEKNKVKEYTGALNLWRQATDYYVQSAAGASNEVVEQIADRLLAIGMIVNDVGKDVVGFYECLDLQPKHLEAWEQAAALYNRLLDEGKANYKDQISRARALGFLHQWKEAEHTLAQVFAENRIVGPDGRLSSAVIGRRPELLNAYLEWGYAQSAAAGEANDKALRAKASEVFENLLRSVPADSKQWWFARYGMIWMLLERGLYDEADVSLKSLERTNPGFDDNKYGLRLKFTNLKQEIALKVPRKPR